MTTTTRRRARETDASVSTDHNERHGDTLERAAEASAIVSASHKSRNMRFVSIEPGRISLHGIALTDAEYAVLRGIAERMKREPVGNQGGGGTRAELEMQIELQKELAR